MKVSELYYRVDTTMAQLKKSKDNLDFAIANKASKENIDVLNELYLADYRTARNLLESEVTIIE